MKKKVTQETANQLRELLEKVISERRCGTFAEKSSTIARAIASARYLFWGVYLQNAHAFSIIGVHLQLFWGWRLGNVRIRGDRHDPLFLDVGVFLLSF